MLENRKESGSYYTPTELVEFMVTYLKKEQQDFDHVLEPSAGDGRFLPLLLSCSNHVEAVELFQEKVQRIEQQYGCEKLSVECENFIRYASINDDRYSLIIGNPPYISLKMMNKEDIAKAKQFCEEVGLPSSAMQNMWFAFVLASCKLLRPNGTVFFVLPMEFLQVQYAEKLRGYLESKFNTIHIISFEDCVFTGIEQEVCLVYLTNKIDDLPYILYEVYPNSKETAIVSRNIIQKNKPLQKWSNAILKDDDIFLLKDFSLNYTKVEKIGTTAPGIVTGGNKYFILTEQQVEAYRCREQVLPILQKSSFVSDNIICIDEAVFDKIKERNKPVYLLNLAKVPQEDLPLKLDEYLEWAGKQKIQGTELKKRFKCANRNPWYGVPIVAKGDIIFFKRYDILPRLYINEMDIHTTDAGYHIRLNEEYDKASVVFCFYNSMTLAQCEFYGRYYGGGVRELVPSEFKKIAIPYREIEEKDVEHLKELFQKKASAFEIVSFVNSKTLELQMPKETISKLEAMRIQLIKQRRRQHVQKVKLLKTDMQ